jgi:hypothetical protein
MDERTQRVGQNEALFRTVNDEAHSLNDTFDVVADPLSAICECGRADCTDRLELRAAEYEAIRQEPTWFGIKPGHDAPDVETVVQRHDRYWVVQKHEGDAARIARSTDPRS